RILIVDDEPAVREALRRSCSSTVRDQAPREAGTPKGGHPVRNGVTALRRFKRLAYWLYGP
ncbi:response regulator, partial [Streptomyces sp. NPDC053755]|uniref:response regulator n=1 Tax=Streptomyces sp. NPDC053755 TaxID=3155815 RepID=UPI003415C6D4